MVSDLSMKLVFWWGMVLAFQGLVTGEEFLQSFPDVQENFLDAFEGTICLSFDLFNFEFCMPDFIGIIAAFLSFPFRILIWLWEFFTLQFIPGIPRWFTLPIELTLLFVLAILAFRILPPLVRAIGDLIPTT